MKLYSWNVNGLKSVVSKGALQDFVRNYAPDVICLQEVKTKMTDEEPAEVTQGALFELAAKPKRAASGLELGFLADYHCYWNSAERAGYAGTAVLTKELPLAVDYGFPAEIEAPYEWADQFGDARREGRVITAEYADFYLVNVYVPNAKSDGLGRLKYRELVWDKALLEYMQMLDAKKPVLLCGDMNVAWQPIDLARPKQNEGNAGYTVEERAGMTNYLAHGFIDTFREYNPEKQQYSWWSYRAGARAKNVGWRIDYFLASERLRERLAGAAICDEVMGSDHCPVMVELEEERK